MSTRMPKIQAFLMAGRIFSNPTCSFVRPMIQSAWKHPQAFSKGFPSTKLCQAPSRQLCVGALTLNPRPVGQNSAATKHCLQTKIEQSSLFPSTQSFSFASNSNSSHFSKDDKGIVVYLGRVRQKFKMLKIFSLSTSAIGVLLQPYLWFTLQDVSLLAVVPLFTAVNAFVFANPFLIHVVAKRYVNELYFNPETKVFTATVLTFLARNQVFTFTANDVTVPDVPGLFTMLKVKGRPIFIDERDFMNMEIYQLMMGFDQPLDLRYPSTENEVKHIKEAITNKD